MPNPSALELIAVLQLGLFQVPGEVYEVTKSYVVTVTLVLIGSLRPDSAERCQSNDSNHCRSCVCV